MIINKISFKRKNEPDSALRTLEFASNFNYIYSNKNSTGKSTLVRFLLYALGFNIPNTKKVKFEEFTIQTEVTNCDNTLLIRREGQKFWVNDIAMVLPNDTSVAHSVIFNCNSLDLLENILGAIYIDQDRGWTLLNRGTIIGGIRFYIEVFLHGLKGKDCDIEIKAALKKVDREIERYRQMKAIAEYKEQAIKSTGEVQLQNGSIAFDTQIDILENSRRELLLKKQSVEKRIKFVECTILDDKKFINWIESHNIIVRGLNGEQIPVTRDTIENYLDNTELNKIEIRRESIELKSIIEEIETINKEISEQTRLVNDETILDTFDHKISEIPIDLIAVENTIKRLTKEQSQYREILRNSAWKQNQWAYKLNNLILSYAKELHIDEYLESGDCYLFKDIKSISGAIYHKMVFVFRICYNLILSEMLQFNVPLFIDSPSGREVEQDAIRDMIAILERDFANHQIFLASINDFFKDNPNNKKIEMNGKLFDVISGQISFFDILSDKKTDE